MSKVIGKYGSELTPDEIDVLQELYNECFSFVATRKKFFELQKQGFIRPHIQPWDAWGEFINCSKILDVDRCCTRMGVNELWGDINHITMDYIREYSPCRTNTAILRSCGIVGESEVKHISTLTFDEVTML